MSGLQTGIGHNIGANRKVLYIAEITRAMQARKEKRLEEALAREDLGALSSSDRIIALKHGLLDNYQCSTRLSQTWMFFRGSCCSSAYFRTTAPAAALMRWVRWPSTFRVRRGQYATRCTERSIVAP
jgi:hypothetical protein